MSSISNQETTEHAVTSYSSGQVDGFITVNHTEHTAPQKATIFLILEIPAIIFVVVANGVVLCLTRKVMNRKSQKMGNRYFVISLSVANLTAGLIGLPLAMFAHWSTLVGSTCRVYQYFMQVSEWAEVYSLVAIAIDRYWVMVRHQTSTQESQKGVSIAAVIVIWTCAVVYGLMGAFTHEVGTRLIKSGHVIYQYRDCYTNQDSSFATFVLIFDCVSLFVIPLMTMCSYYTAIVRFIQREQQHSTSATKNLKYKVIRVILLLMTIFVLFNLPLHIFELCSHFTHTYLPQENAIREVLEYIAFLNFGVNAFIYALLNVNYKRAAPTKWYRCCINIQVNPDTGTEVYPSNSRNVNTEKNRQCDKFRAPHPKSTLPMVNKY